MLDLKALLSKILDAIKVDYVVEEGTSGYWYYRKWNSGRAECWYRANLGQITLSTQLSTDIVSAMFRLEFPFTFKAIPMCLFNYEGNSTGYCWVQHSSGYNTTTRYSYGIRLARIGTSSVALQNNYVNCYACGTWGGVINLIKYYLAQLNTFSFERGCVVC